MKVDLNPTELNTILAALRFFQRKYAHAEEWARIQEFTPILSDEEIDTLCEHVNVGDGHPLVGMQIENDGAMWEFVMVHDGEAYFECVDDVVDTMIVPIHVAEEWFHGSASDNWKL